MKHLTPIRSIRKYCLDCCVGSSKEVKLCVIPACPLFPLRFGKGAKGVSPLKMIRKNCLGCGEGTAFDVKNCELTDCFLYHVRFGKNPNLVGKRGRGNPDFGKIATTFRRKSQETDNSEANASEDKQFLQETNVKEDI